MRQEEIASRRLAISSWRIFAQKDQTSASRLFDLFGQVYAN
jgi:hypothetical protein